MEYRPGICAIIFRKISAGRTLFLIFHRTKNWVGFEFLKGGIKEGETEKGCLLRELAEETGAKKYKITKTPYVFQYSWLKSFTKDRHKYTGARNHLYIIEIFDENVKIDKREHDDFKWVTAGEALRLLTYDNLKQALKYVEKEFHDILKG